MAPQGVLQQTEIDFHCGHHGHGNPVFHAGLEFPLVNGFYGLLIQTHAQASNDLNIADAAFLIDYQTEQNRAAVLGFTRLFGVFGVYLMEHHGRTDPSADAIDSTTVASTRAGSETGAVSGADATAVAATDPSTRADAIRGFGDFREGITKKIRVDVGNRRVRRRDDGWLHGQYRMEIADNRLRGNELLQRDLGQFSLACGRG